MQSVPYPSLETIKEMVAYFQRTDLPDNIQFTSGEKVINMRKFADAHIEALRWQYHNNKRNGRYIFESYWEKLVEVRRAIEKNNK